VNVGHLWNVSCAGAGRIAAGFFSKFLYIFASRKETWIRLHDGLDTSFKAVASNSCRLSPKDGFCPEKFTNHITTTLNVLYMLILSHIYNEVNFSGYA
jgi:hypothetical protein